jgi:hypothetical protein
METFVLISKKIKLNLEVKMIKILKVMLHNLLWKETGIEGTTFHKLVYGIHKVRVGLHQLYKIDQVKKH